jgi:uncharacterized protein
VRILVLLALLAVCWLPFAVPIAYSVRDPNLVGILAMSLLFVEFLLLIRYWGKWVNRQAHIFRSYGLVASWQGGLEFLIGLGIGTASTLVLFLVQGWLGWITWQPAPGSLFRIILEGLLSAAGIGFAEELVFRGWILDELQRDYSPKLSLWADSFIYAGLHFLKPLLDMLRSLPQFPGLLLLGLILVWAKRATGGRLGLSIGFHAGLVWGYYIINVGQLTKPSHQVSDWLTGVNGNPIAGGMGLLFLAAIAFWVRKRALQPGSIDRATRV